MNIGQKMRLRSQLLLAMSIGIVVIISVITVVVSEWERQLLTTLNLEKNFLVTQQFSPIAADNFKTIVIHEKVIVPLMYRPDVVYVFVTDPQGQILASFDPTLLSSTDPQIVLPLFRSPVLQEREVPFPNFEYTGTFLTHETNLLKDVVYEGQQRGKTNEAIFDNVQQLYNGDTFIGYLRIGFSRKPLEDRLALIRYGIIGIGTLIIVISISLTLFFTRRIVHPLQQLTTEVSKVHTSLENGALDDHLAQIHPENIIASNHEIKELQDAFIHMRTFVVKSWSELSQANVALEVTKEELEDLNLNLEKEVQERTHELRQSFNQLEQQNITLLASNRKLEDLNSNQEKILSQLHSIQSEHLQGLQSSLELLKHQEYSQKLIITDDNTKLREIIRNFERNLHEIEEIFRPITTLYKVNQAIRSKKVLLAVSEKSQQIIAKMALRGTGVELDIVSNFKEGWELLEQKFYDILYVDEQSIELAALAHRQNIDTQFVFMTSENVADYLPTLLKYPFLTNIVSRREGDRTFTLKNILTTVGKLSSGDLFGIDKYLSWGIDIQETLITGSDRREVLLQKMEDYLKNLGIHRNLISKSVLVAEELLMNAIYDAPCDTQGKALYNHLPRTEPVYLKPEEQGMFRYACDGVLLAISVEDPFGAFHRETILNYLQHSYNKTADVEHKDKGGAGYGLYQIMEITDLLVFNVKNEIKTEAIAIFNLDMNKAKSVSGTSFHYFYG